VIGCLRRDKRRVRPVVCPKRLSLKDWELGVDRREMGSCRTRVVLPKNRSGILRSE
jgi:hypothetical protein